MFQNYCTKLHVYPWPYHEGLRHHTPTLLLWIQHTDGPSTKVGRSRFTMLEPLTNHRWMSHTQHCNIKRDTVGHVMKLYQKIDEFEIKLAKHLKRLKIAINLFVSILQEKSWTVEGHHGQNMFILPASQVKNMWFQTHDESFLWILIMDENKRKYQMLWSVNTLVLLPDWLFVSGAVLELGRSPEDWRLLFKQFPIKFFGSAFSLNNDIASSTC
jgi:hypothetical protein